MVGGESEPTRRDGGEGGRRVLDTAQQLRSCQDPLQLQSRNKRGTGCGFFATAMSFVDRRNQITSDETSGGNSKKKSEIRERSHDIVATWPCPTEDNVMSSVETALRR